jgi:hypothetical protein
LPTVRNALLRTKQYTHAVLTQKFHEEEFPIPRAMHW